MKRALKVSVGLIIIIIISGLILLFVMGWNTGYMTPPERDVVLNSAKQWAINELMSSDENVLTTFRYPYMGTKSQKGDAGEFSIVVEKEVEVESYNSFAINIKGIDTVSQNAVSNNKISFTYPRVVNITGMQKISLVRSQIAISKDINAGTYGFRVIVCKGESVPADSCDITSANYYGDTDFTFNVI